MSNHSNETSAGLGANDGSPWCEIRLADRTMRYRRLGAGKPLVLLTQVGAEPWPDVLEAIAERRRIYVPDLPADQGGFVAWLQGFLDGVGAERPAIVATGTSCIPALEFALLEAERVDRLVLIPDGAADETGLDGALSPSRDGPSLPILLLRREHPDAAAVELMTRFLGPSVRD